MTAPPVPPAETAEPGAVVTPERTVRFEELVAVHPVYASHTMAEHLEQATERTGAESH